MKCSSYYNIWNVLVTRTLNVTTNKQHSQAQYELMIEERKNIIIVNKGVIKLGVNKGNIFNFFVSYKQKLVTNCNQYFAFIL